MGKLDVPMKGVQCRLIFSPNIVSLSKRFQFIDKGNSDIVRLYFFMRRELMQRLLRRVNIFEVV